MTVCLLYADEGQAPSSSASLLMISLARCVVYLYALRQILQLNVAQFKKRKMPKVNSTSPKERLLISNDENGVVGNVMLIELAV